MRWSQTLQRWCVFSPDLIRAVMRDRRFAVPSYDLSVLEDRLGIALPLTKAAMRGLPLTNEGEVHKTQRAEFARTLARRSDAAIAAFGAALSARLQAVADLPHSTSFCLVADVMRPASRALIAALADLHLDDACNLEMLPQSFDDSISVRRRLDIESLLQKISGKAPHDEALLMGLGTIMVSANTLLGSLVRSVVDQIERNPVMRLDAIAWPADLPCTSLSLVEKVCVESASVGGTAFERGDRLRLYIEAGGVDLHGNSVPSDLFFAVGPHRCIGMSLSVASWRCTTRLLSSMQGRWQILSSATRPFDRVFHFPEEVRLVTHAI